MGFSFFFSSRMRVLVVLVVLCAVGWAQTVRTGEPDRVVNPPDWHGTWTANNRYGGVMYACPQGDRLYGVYSNAGFFIGRMDDEKRTVTGNYWEGGRGDRNDWQGSFEIKITEDNQEFDGFFHRVSQDGTELRWHEYRLGAPYPSTPSNTDCLVPSREPLLGSFFRRPTATASPAEYHLCHDEWGQLYGSYLGTDGFVEGWTVDSATGFHGYRYDSNGQSGAYILRSISDTEVRGFYWRGYLVRQNLPTSTEEILDRSSFTVAPSECEQVGPGFLRRLRGPEEKTDNNGAGVLSFNILIVVACLFFALM